jgi:7-keto-8-aminopelargonate synthetase-like enzyme
MTTSSSYPVPKLAAEVARLIAEHPLVDAVVDQVDGRMIRVGDHWLADFASCNYLGLDLDPEVVAGIPSFVTRWGPIRAGPAGSPARRCTRTSRPPLASCSGSRTCWPSRP